MIVFKEKQYSTGLALRVKRAMVPVLQGGTGMSKRGALRTVAKAGTSGIKAATKEASRHLPVEAKIGATIGTFTPVPGGTILGAVGGGQIHRIRKAI